VTESAEASWASRNVSEDELAAAVKEAALAGLMEVRAAFAEHELWAWPDGAGGVQVAIDGIKLGEFWVHEASWFAFTINHLYPDADTYPHYVRGDLARADGEALVAPFHTGQTFQEQPAVMVSRSSPKRVSGLSTAARKAFTVISFIQSQKRVAEESA